MSIRHDLVDLILMALDDPRSPSIAHISAMAGRRARVENGIDAILARYAVVDREELKAALDEASSIERYFELRGRTEVSGNIRQAFTPILCLFPMGPTSEATDVDR